jgi:hypothetical protein
LEAHVNFLTPDDFDDRSPEERLPERLMLLAADLSDKLASPPYHVARKVLGS